MSQERQPWSSRFRPCSLDEIAGNERAIKQLQKWLESWKKGIPKQRAVFLHGPPGVGKTCSVVVLANVLDYHLMEVNASDYRTRKNIESLIGRGIHQRFTLMGKRRMILFDELEGVSGREDYGGIGAIASIIKETEVPIVLIATSLGERWEDKFRPLIRITLHIEYKPVPFSQVFSKLEEIMEKNGVDVDLAVLELLAEHSKGDLRSTINDLESISRGKRKVTIEDVDSLGVRDRKDYTPEALMKMFSAKTLKDARKIISSAHLPYDDLYDWIYENLPLILDNSSDLAEGLEALARADIHQTRAKRTQNYRLIKYMFNEMTGGTVFSNRKSQGVGLLKIVRQKVVELGFHPSMFTITETIGGISVKPNRYLKNDWRKVNTALRSMGASWIRGGGQWEIPYFRSPQLVWRYRRTYHSRRRRNSIAEKIAEKCHTSKKEAVAEIIPLIKIIYGGNESMSNNITTWLDFDDSEIDWLKK